MRGRGKGFVDVLDARVRQLWPEAPAPFSVWDAEPGYQRTWWTDGAKAVTCWHESGAWTVHSGEAEYTSTGPLERVMLLAGWIPVDDSAGA